MRLLITIILLLFSIFIIAQEEETPTFAPDRPGQTTGTSIVPKGYFHIETGYLYSKFAESFGIDYTESIDNNSGTLLRYGIFKNTEIRLSIGYNWTDNTKIFESFNGVYYGVETRSQSMPLSPGIKILMFEEKGILPNISFFGNLNLPDFYNGDSDFNSITPLFGFAFSNTINDYFSIGYNIGGTWYSAYYYYFGITTQAFYSLAFCFTPFKNFACFVEPYGTYNKYDEFSNYIDFGVSYSILHNLVIDLYGKPIFFNNAITQDWYIAGGISYRLPK